jgi:glucarate dehydratase
MVQATYNNGTNMAAKTPVITSMQVMPVAGHDSALFDPCGAHGPGFLRTPVLQKDSAGPGGTGEVPGGAGTTRALENAIPRMVGTQAGRFRHPSNAVREGIAGKRPGHKPNPQTLQHQVIPAAEAAVLKLSHDINLGLENVVTAIGAAAIVHSRLDDSPRLPGLGH